MATLRSRFDDPTDEALRNETDMMTTVSAGFKTRRFTFDDPRWIAQSILGMLAVVAMGFAVNVAVISRLEQRSAQTRAFDKLRNDLALGTAPVGSVLASRRVLASGTPIGLLEVSSLHMRQVIVEGTSGSALTSGPGHLRSTVFPGATGSSVILGRASSYGGPFGRLHRLRKGAKIVVTTGVGRTTFAVVDVRRTGDPLPPVAANGTARLTLVTATGPPFVPTGVLRVDADADGPGQPPSSVAVPSVSLAERPMGSDPNALFPLVLLLQALLALTLGGAWAWHRWGHPEAWMVLFPPSLLLCILVNDQVARLLPNLL